MASSVVLGNGCKIQNNVSLYEGVVCEEEVFWTLRFHEWYNPCYEQALGIIYTAWAKEQLSVPMRPLLVASRLAPIALWVQEL